MPPLQPQDFADVTAAASRSQDRRPWVLVLAGGSGTRLESLTTGTDGVVVPKQYCRLVDDR